MDHWSIPRGRASGGNTSCLMLRLAGLLLGALFLMLTIVMGRAD